MWIGLELSTVRMETLSVATLSVATLSVAEHNVGAFSMVTPNKIKRLEESVSHFGRKNSNEATACLFPTNAIHFVAFLDSAWRFAFLNILQTGEIHLPRQNIGYLDRNKVELCKLRFFGYSTVQALLASLAIFYL